MQAANVYWDPDTTVAGNSTVTGAGMGGAGVWDLSNFNWWNGSAGSGQAWSNGGDTAIFWGSSPGTVTLGTGITAGGLIFNTLGYTIAPTLNETLTLAPPAGVASPMIAVNNAGLGASRATISAALLGSNGFTKTGNGALVLTGNNTGLTGDIAIKGGSLIITNANQLGSPTGTAISVTGVAQTGNPGYTGGALVLQGGSVSASSPGVIVTREVSIAGRGPGALNLTGGLVSIGYNTLAGGLSTAGPASQARAWATHGNTVVSGDVFLGGGVGDATIIYGNGNWIISGQVSGVDSSGDRFIKTGNIVASTLWLQNPNNTFAQPVRVDSGTVRVTVNGALGMNAGTGQVDLNNGTLEVRTDAAAGFAGRTIRLRNNVTGTVFVDHDISGPLGIGDSLQNQTVTFGALTRDSGANNSNFNYRGRNGYNVSFTSALPVTPAEYRSWTVDNGSSGTVTYNGNVWNTTATTAGTFTVQGNGETVITGSVIASGALHNLTKGGSGTFYFGGTSNAGNYTGATTINGGTLSFSNVGGFSASSGISIGNATTTPGTLTYTGVEAELNKPITINTTTANAYINASGSGALTLSGSLTNGVGAGGAHAIILGGTNTGDNTLTAAIGAGVSGVTSLQKIGTGTWVLAPVSNNGFTGTTTVAGGVLKLKEAAGNFDILPDGASGGVIFNTDTFTQAAGGRLVYVGASGAASTESVGSLTGTMGHGIVEAVPTGVGSATLTFSSLAGRAAGASINVMNTGTVIISGASGFQNAGVFFNGTDFAYGASGVLRAGVYTDGLGGSGGDLDFITSATALTTAMHNQITGSFSTGALPINSLKIDGSNTLTLTGNLTVGTAAGSGIIQSSGSGKIDGAAGNVATSAAGNDLQVRVEGSGTALEIARPITTSTAGLTKSGAGTLTLSAANTITGTVYVNEGTLMMATGGTLGASGINLAVRQNSIFNLNGISLGTAASATNAVNSLNGAGTVTNSGALASLRVGEGGGSGYFTGAITGNVALVKSGSGTLSLTNANSNYTSLTIMGGTVAFALPEGTTTMNADTNSPLGRGATAAALTFNAGVLLYTGSNTTIFSATQSPSFSTDRQFTLAGNATIQSSGQFGNNVLAGGARNDASIIFASNADLSFSGTGVRTLTLGGNSLGDNEMRLHLINNTNGGGALSLTKADAGLWILNPSSSNTYTGDTTISGGALRAMVTGAPGTVLGISNSSLLTINGGVLETSGLFNRTLGSTTGTNQVRITGGASGFAAATADRLVVLLGGGDLTWTNANFNPSSLVLGSSTALGETEIANNINLNGGTRTVTTTANGNTGTMITAGILSGVISNSTGTGNLTKNGAGVLILGNANTYNGNTSLGDGTLIVSSIGNSSGTVSSSVGASGGTLSYTGNATLQLMYVGAGEVATRPVTISAAMTAARTYRLDSSGSGALVLENFTNNKTGNFALIFDMRGSNTDNNRINSVFGDGLAGGTHIVKSDGGVWILGNTANTLASGVRVDGGMLGLASGGSLGAAGFLAPTTALSDNTSTVTVGPTLAAQLKVGMLVQGPGVGYGDYITSINAAAGTFTLSAARTIASGASLQFGGLSMSNGAIFSADGNPLVINQPLTLNNNAAAVFTGAADITLNGQFRLTAGGNDMILSNNMEGGAILRLNSDLVNFKTNNQTFNIRGTGSTIWDGVLANATNGSNTTTLNIGIANNASLTLMGAPNTYTGATTLLQGTLILNKTLGATSGLNFNGGVLQAGIPLTTANGTALATPITLGGDPATISGTNSIDLTAAAALTVSASRQLVNNLSGGAVLTVTGGITATSTLTVNGSGTTIVNGVVSGTAGAITMAGTGTLNLNGANTATGALTVSRGTLVLGEASGAWNTAGNTFTLNTNGTLKLDNSSSENTNRMLDSGAIAMNGGTLEFVGDVDGTNETVGAMAVNGIMGTIKMSGNGPNILTLTSVNFVNSGSSLDFSSIAGLGSTNKVMIPTIQVGGTTYSTAGTLLPRIMILGDFTRYDGTNGVVAFTAYNNSNDLNTALTTDTPNVTASAGLALSKTLNALKINGNGLTVGTLGRNLTVTTGAILNTGVAGSSNTLNAAQIFLSQQGFIQVDADTTLEVNGAFVNNGTINKVGGGTLRLNAPQFYNTTTNISGGTVVLNGGLNTMFATGNGVPASINVDLGATLDLNGNTQYVGAFGNTGAGLPGSAGTLTNSVGTPLFVTRDGGTFCRADHGHNELGQDRRKHSGAFERQLSGGHPQCSGRHPVPAG